MSIDDIGLRVEVDIPPTTYGNDLVINMERRNVKGQSFMFELGKDKWVESKSEGIDEREILSFSRVIEVGPVTMPAYKQTDVFARSREDVLTERIVTPEPTKSTAVELLDIEREYLVNNLQFKTKNK
jgi:phage head maturation protease